MSFPATVDVVGLDGETTLMRHVAAAKCTKNDKLSCVKLAISQDHPR